MAPTSALSEITPLLSIKELTIALHHAKASQPLVSNVSLDIYPGETVALIGESGSGKSLTSLAIMRLLPEAIMQSSGQIWWRGADILTQGEQQMQTMRGKEIALMFQEPMTALNPLHSIRKQITESIVLHEPQLTSAQIEQRLKALLMQVQLEELYTRLDALPHMLSGGQRQRVLLAISLAATPTLLIADEPTTALDVTTQKHILDQLVLLKKQQQMSMLFISHDIHVVRNLADRVYVMQQGKVVESGTTAALFDNPQHPYTQQLLTAYNFPARKPPTVHDGILLAAEKLSVSVQTDRSWFRKKPRKTLLENINFSLLPGETLGVVGESGSGKSTLAYALLRLMQAEGKVVFEKQSLLTLSSQAMRSLRRSLQIVFQDPFASLNPRMTIGAIVAEGLLAHESLSKPEIEARVVASLEEVGLSSEARLRYPHEFSGGQRQRIAIARALILKPKMLVLDEPTSALDITTQRRIIALLSDIQQRYGIAMLFISHDIRVVRAVSHHLLVLCQGKVVEYGETEQVLSTPSHSYTKQLLASAYGIGM